MQRNDGHTKAQIDHVPAGARWDRSVTDISRLKTVNGANLRVALQNGFNGLQQTATQDPDNRWPFLRRDKMHIGGFSKG